VLDLELTPEDTLNFVKGAMITNKVLILGANGARVAIDLFLRETNAQLTHYLRNARKALGVRTCYPNLAGPLKQMAETIVDVCRPAWFTSADEVDYETTTKGEPFKGYIVSRKSVADLVVKLALDPHLEVRQA
jgi:hypothetical protein